MRRPALMRVGLENRSQRRRSGTERLMEILRVPTRVFLGEKRLRRRRWETLTSRDGIQRTSMLSLKTKARSGLWVKWETGGSGLRARLRHSRGSKRLPFIQDIRRTSLTATIT